MGNVNWDTKMGGNTGEAKCAHLAAGRVYSHFQSPWMLWQQPWCACPVLPGGVCTHGRQVGRGVLGGILVAWILVSVLQFNSASHQDLSPSEGPQRQTSPFLTLQTSHFSETPNFWMCWSLLPFHSAPVSTRPRIILRSWHGWLVPHMPGLLYPTPSSSPSSLTPDQQRTAHLKLTPISGTTELLSLKWMYPDTLSTIFFP